jgi:hypothetical protein
MIKYSLVLLSLLSINPVHAQEEYTLQVIDSWKECMEIESALRSKYKVIVNRGSEAAVYRDGNRVTVLPGVKPWVERFEMPKLPGEHFSNSKPVMTDGTTWVSLECSRLNKQNHLFIWNKQQWDARAEAIKQRNLEQQQKNQDKLKSLGL